MLALAAQAKREAHYCSKFVLAPYVLPAAAAEHWRALALGAMDEPSRKNVLRMYATQAGGGVDGERRAKRPRSAD